MVPIPEGTFQRGKCTVKVSAFAIGAMEVSQAQWIKAMGSNPSIFRGDDLPLENVTWEEAMAFCQYLNQYSGIPLPEGYRFSLPTEAQWEYVVEQFRKGKEMPIWNLKALESIRPKDSVPEYPDLVGYFTWYRLGTPLEKWLSDTVHLNNRGEYMQACVWYAMLLGRNPEEVEYVPEGIDATFARKLRTLVKDAIAQYIQGK